MKVATFHPVRLCGSAIVPPAKSEAHRALLLAALGDGTCCLQGFPQPLCEDIQAMINGITALGATVCWAEDALTVVPAPKREINDAPKTFHVNACAAALRMLIPAFWSRGQAVCITMEPGLFARPLDAFIPLAEQSGGQMILTPPKGENPAMVELKGKMDAGEYEVDGSLSSQFASGLLIALAHGTDAAGCSAPSRLTITPPIVSRPYLNMTLAQMKEFQIPFQETEEGVFSLPGGCGENPEKGQVTGDWSQGAVLLCADAMGSHISVQGLPMPAADKPALQGDARILEALEKMGLSLRNTGDGIGVKNITSSDLLPLTLDCTDIPDIAPILALTLTRAQGTSHLTGVKRLRVKECDRLAATEKWLTQMGVTVKISEDSDMLSISGLPGGQKLKGGFTADAQGDHRMVMLLATAALVADAPITVTGVESLDKSWPGFLETYQKLGGLIS